MTVWVTEVRQAGRVKICRMQASTAEELHNMAARIRIAERKPDRTMYEHYDIDDAKRWEVIRRGAISVTTEELRGIISALEEIGDLL